MCQGLPLRVSRYDVLTSLVSVSGGIFYHSVTELLGNLYLIDTILKTHPVQPLTALLDPEPQTPDPKPQTLKPEP